MTETQVLSNLKFEIGQFKWRARRQNFAAFFLFANPNQLTPPPPPRYLQGLTPTNPPWILNILLPQ